MKPDKDWETQLKDGLFDLPKERWAALEVDLLRRVRAEESVPARPWHLVVLETLKSLLRPAPLAVGLACLLLSVSWWFLHQESTEPKLAAMEQLEHWNNGEVLQSDSSRTWNWTASRCTLTLAGKARRMESAQGVRLRLEQGDVRFGVNPRKPGESFVVEFGACEATVVGTAFSLHYDSASTTASVEHGKVRIKTASGFEKLLLGGQHWNCEEPHATLRRPDSAPAPTAVAAPRARPAIQVANLDPEWATLEQRCSISEAQCMEASANYLLAHPVGERSAKAGLRWAGIAKKKGDLRDAMYALESAAGAQAGDLSSEARLEICALQGQRLGKIAQARENLEALLTQLPARSPLRLRAEQLRTELSADAH
jgi:FecR protein